MSNLALLGGEPVRKESYPEWPVHDERDIEAVTRVIKSGKWGGYPYPGPETTAFLEEFRAMQGGDYAVACVNGTVTMEVALRAAGIGWGDEVIVPAYTFQATAAAPMAAGCIPVIVDVDPNSYCMDSQAAEAAITDKTKAIIPVHLGAHMTDMDAITLSTSRLVSADRLSPQIGWRIIVAAAMANLVFKVGIVAMLGHRRLLCRTLILFGILIAVGGVLIAVLP